MDIPVKFYSINLWSLSRNEALSSSSTFFRTIDPLRCFSTLFELARKWRLIAFDESTVKRQRVIKRQTMCNEKLFALSLLVSSLFHKFVIAILHRALHSSVNFLGGLFSAQGDFSPRQVRLQIKCRRESGEVIFSC